MATRWSELSPRQRKIIMWLADPDASGKRFEPIILSDLFRLGAIDMDPETRRVVLTETGVRICLELMVWEENAIERGPAAAGAGRGVRNIMPDAPAAPRR